MNKTLQLFLVVCILSVSVHSASNSSNVTNSTEKLEEMNRVAEIGNELMYELMVMEDTKSVSNQKETWHAQNIACKDLHFCRQHEDCSRKTRTKKVGPWYNKKTVKEYYYLGDCTNKHWYIVDFTTVGEFKQGELSLGAFNTASINKKSNNSVELTFIGDVAFKGNFNIKRLFKGYIKDDSYVYDEKPRVTIVVSFTMDKTGEWVAEMENKSVAVDLINYNPNIENNLKALAKQKLQSMIRDKIISNQMLPTQVEIQEFFS